MVCASSIAGSALRPNSSLAGVLGSSGLASAGSTTGLSVPLSCALAVPAAKHNTASSEEAVSRPRKREFAPFGDLFIVVIPATSHRKSAAPVRAYAGQGRRRALKLNAAP